MFLGVMMAGFTGVMIAVPIMAFDCKHDARPRAVIMTYQQETEFWYYSLFADTRLPSWPGPCLGVYDVSL